MSLFRRRFFFSAPFLLVLIIITGLVVIPARPVWFLTGKTPLQVKAEEVHSTVAMALLDHPRFNLLRIYNKGKNVVLAYSDLDKGHYTESEYTGFNIFSNRIFTCDDNVWFCLKDKDLSCWLCSAFDENGNPDFQTRLLHKNSWKGNITPVCSAFENGTKVTYELSSTQKLPYTITARQDTIVLNLESSWADQMLYTPITKVMESPYYQLVADSLSNFTAEDFSSRDIYRIITDKIRSHWFSNTLGTNRGDAFFNGAIHNVCDLDNNGKDDMLIMYGGDRLIPGYLIRYELQSNQIHWKVPFYLPIMQSDFFDFDNDGKKEIVLAFYSSGITCSDDWFDFDLKLDTSKSYLLILDSNGRLKKINGNDALLETGGFTTLPVFHILPSGKILTAPTFRRPAKKCNLLLVDFFENTIDTLDIDYEKALGFDKHADEIDFLYMKNGLLNKTSFDKNLNIVDHLSSKVYNLSSYYPGNTFSYQNNEYYVMNPFQIIDKNLKVIYEDRNLDFQELQEQGDNLYILNPITDTKSYRIMKFVLSPNKKLNMTYITLWILFILLLLVYIVTRAVFSPPPGALEGSYAVLYSFLGIFYNWRIFGKSSLYTQPVIASFSKKHFYDMISDISENYKQVSVKHFGLLKLFIFRLSINNEMHIIQRVAHDIKNQIHLISLELQQSDLDLKIPEETKSSLTKVNNVLTDIFHKSSMLSNFTRLNLMQKENCNLISIIDDLLIRYNSHPRFLDIVWKPEIASLDIEADENLILTALINLLDNSLKYSPQNTKIYIEIEKDYKYAKLSFRNRRTKESEKMLLQIKKRSEILPGSGIGLNVTEKIILSHDGEMNIDFTNGEALVIIKLPI